MEADQHRGDTKAGALASFDNQLHALTASGRSLVPEGRDKEEDALRKSAAEAYQRWRNTPAGHRQVLLPDTDGKFREIDVKDMKLADHKVVTLKAMTTRDPDYRPFLTRLHNRMNRVGISHSTVEVRFENLAISARVSTGSRALPSLPNAFMDFAQAPLKLCGFDLDGKQELPILKSISGVIRPGRFTLLLGPPSSGKSVLLKALSGALENGSLQTSGDITYNGHSLDEFVSQRTSSYIDQQDVHIAELSVRETLDFAARCQGVGHKAEELRALMEREAAARIDPDPEIDAFMKAEAQEGGRYSIVTELMLRLLGLDYVADTFIGDVMIRGISGGQKKRVTTGEMTVGPKKTLFMDEISTGLDSSTTHQIVRILADFCHMRDATILLALLQPAPEVFDLFDDVLLLAEGHIVFHGPREEVLPFFESMGFALPERKGIADFLQEVTSAKDQAQYWADTSRPYCFVPVAEFAEAFRAKTPAAQRSRDALDMPYDRASSPEGTLVRNRYGLTAGKMLRALLRRELILVQHNALIYGFRFFQCIWNALLVSTLFVRGTRSTDSIDEAGYYLGVLFFSAISMLFNNWAEVQLLVKRLPSHFKQRDLLFYPAWAFALPTIILSIPQSLVESLVWTCIVYWVVGLQPAASAFFTFWLFSFLMHNFAVAMFRAVAAASRDPNIANSVAVLTATMVLNLGGVNLPQDSVRWYWRWLLWCNPLWWAQRALALNEFTASRWSGAGPIPGTQIGPLFLEQRNFGVSKTWIWGGVAFIVVAIILTNLFIIACLTWLKLPRQARALAVADGDAAAADEPIKPNSSRSLQLSDSANSSATSGKDVAIDVSTAAGGQRPESRHVFNGALAAGKKGVEGCGSAGSALPFEQLWLSFKNVSYSVDLPAGMEPPEHPKNNGAAKPRLYLLNDVSGAFRPNVLTALIGETGAGKTTLMDVLAGRKTSGIVEGDIRVQGHPKEQSTFQRVSGYVEQNDIHSPQTTVHEALLFSASLRLRGNPSKETVSAFVEETMRVVELMPLHDALVGEPGRSGLSVEQRKRLTIAVELVANPSIVFMDEPTSGLDARAAAIVMRAVRNTVDTGRTVVCTIHQPSIDVFESFNELLLMKRGGRIIFHGALGKRSSSLVEYFQGIEGVPPIADGYNPATWALDVTNGAAERRLNLDFADVYTSSELFKRTEALVDELSQPPPGSHPLRYAERYSRSYWQQFATCLWRFRQAYWRTPYYTAVRVLFTVIMALIFGTTYWALGASRSQEKDVLQIVSALFTASMFLGIYNSNAVQPVISLERPVFYRERAAGMFAAIPYAMAQFAVEIPYVLVQSVIFSVVVYAMVRFTWGTEFLFFWLFELLGLLFFTSMGIAGVACTPNIIVASIISGSLYFLFAIESGFFLPAPEIPGWHIWLHYLNPVGWLVYGQVGSQLGRVHSTILRANGDVLQVSEYIDKFYGFRYDLLGIPVAVLVCEIALLWVLISWSYARLNWEKR